MSIRNQAAKARRSFSSSAGRCKTEHAHSWAMTGDPITVSTNYCDSENRVLGNCLSGVQSGTIRPTCCSDQLMGDREFRADDQTPKLVSVVIPAYNFEQYVGETIESALAQTYSAIEVVVVNDGSTDGTAQVIAGFGDRVRQITKQNGGLATARNRGIKEARGELLVFLDADDLLEPQAVETMCAALAAQPPDFALIACHYSVIDPDGNSLSDSPNTMDEASIENSAGWEVSYRDLVMRNRFSPIVLVRREVIVEKGMFDMSFGTAEQGSEDRDLWIRLAQNRRIWMLESVLAKKRIHPENMSSDGRRQTASMRRTLKKARQDGTIPSTNLLFWSQVSAVQHFQSALMFRDAGQRGAAWRELIQSFVVWPWACPAAAAGLPRWFRFRILLGWSRRLLLGIDHSTS